MKKQHYSVHTASFIPIKANILCIILYIGCALLCNLFVNMEIFALIIPMVVFFLEKESKFIRFHALQIAYIHGLLFMFVVLFNSLVSVYIGMINSASTSNVELLATSLNVFSNFLTIFAFIVLIIDCIGFVQANKWNTFRIPFIGKTISIAVKEN